MDSSLGQAQGNPLAKRFAKCKKNTGENPRCRFKLFLVTDRLPAVEVFLPVLAAHRSFDGLQLVLAFFAGQRVLGQHLKMWLQFMVLFCPRKQAFLQPKAHFLRKYFVFL